MAKFDDILEEIKNLDEAEIPTSEKAETSTSKKTGEKMSDRINLEYFLQMILGILFVLCWITALCDMIGLK